MTTLETYEHNYTRIQKKMGVSAGLTWEQKSPPQNIKTHINYEQHAPII